MTKKNTLKEAPYVPRRIYDREAGKSVQIGWQLASYASHYSEQIEWRPNEPFYASLDLVDMERGRSAARFIWDHGATRTHYPMFMAGMLDLAKSTFIHHGEAVGWWIVVKRGENYGIERYDG